MSTHREAIDEYNSEDENGRCRLIYAYFGTAVYFCQVLEESLAIMLWTGRIFKDKVKTNKEVNDIIDSIEGSKKTLGNFINEVKQYYNLTDKLTLGLATLLEKRNYLIHRYFKVESQKFFSDLGRLEMLDYFCNLIDDINLIDEQLNLYYSDYVDRMGLTQDKLDEIMRQLKQEELDREEKYFRAQTE